MSRSVFDSGRDNRGGYTNEGAQRFSRLEFEDSSVPSRIALPRRIPGRPDGRIDSREYCRTVSDLAEIPTRVQEEEQRVAMERQQMLRYLVAFSITFVVLLLLLGYQMQRVVARGLEKVPSRTAKPKSRHTRVTPQRIPARHKAFTESL